MAVIFYLSGTGNSLYAAKSIAQELEQCRLEGITGYLKAPYNKQGRRYRQLRPAPRKALLNNR